MKYTLTFLYKDIFRIQKFIIGVAQTNEGVGRRSTRFNERREVYGGILIK